MIFDDFAGLKRSVARGYAGWAGSGHHPRMIDYMAEQSGCVQRGR
jgi:hypothetical protein